MTSTQAARTNLGSTNASINHSIVLGTGVFRIAYAGTYIGGNRNQQEAVCKCFKPQFRAMEFEFFESDFHIIDKAIELALIWNQNCQRGKEIMITRGDVVRAGVGQIPYLVEPLIRYFQKYTSNNGWISKNIGWEGEAMEAFCHFTYHRTGGQLIVCDLQGRYRFNKYSKEKCRFELTDPAICSRRRTYGPTDLMEKGIETFFFNHRCNQFCHSFGGNWSSPRNHRSWFESTQGTSMLSSAFNQQLDIRNQTKFTSTLQPINDDSDGDY